MAICTFYQRGQCKFGDNCRNEHPGSSQTNSSNFSGGFNSNNNRFGMFGGGDRYRPGQQSGGAFGGGRSQPRFNLSKDVIKADLADERPEYPLSCYGPGREAPRQLIEGPVEVSPDELRWRYYQQRASGNENAAQQEERNLSDQMKQQVDRVLRDLDGAIKYIEDGLDIHPNRLDIAQGKAPVNASSGSASSSTPFSKPANANPFGGGAQTSTPAFGQPSNAGFSQPRLTAFGQPNNPGQTTSAFGQPSNPGQTTSAFGQPSNPGQTTSAFGQPSAMGGASAFGKPSMPGASAFGQPSNVGSSSAFGQPSGLGGGSAFGKPSMPGAGSAFGQASTLGQQSAFGQPSAPGTTSAFGKPSAPGQPSAFAQANALGQNSAFGKSAFGQSAFGQPSQAGAGAGAGASPFGQKAQQSSPFGQQQSQGNQPSSFGQQTQNNQPSPFGQQQQVQSQSQPQPNPFGSPRASQTPAFGAPGFGQPSPSPFGTQNQTQQQTTVNANPFAQKTQTTTSAPSPFGQSQQSSQPFGQPQQQQQQSAPSPFAQVQPQPASGSAKSADPKDRFKEGKPEEYQGEQGKKLEEIYRRVAQLGNFNDDEEIPIVPPKCEWIVPVA